MPNTTNMTRASAVKVSGLRKAYGEKKVLDGIDLEVAAGTVFALLGPNGAGKTTTVRILSTLIAADGGQAAVAGRDLTTEPDAIRAAIGVTGQFSAVDNLLTASENLILMTDLYRLGRRAGRARATELLERFGLSDVADKPISTFSGGMRRRLDLAMTLVGDPSVIFLDEPTTGLDPRSRRELWEIVRELVANGVTIFLTTQYLEEADQLADRIAVLDGGRIVAQGTATELKKLIPGGHIMARFAGTASLAAAAAALDTTEVDHDALTVQVPSDGGMDSLRSVIARLDAAGTPAVELSLHTPDLDDVFLALTSH
ncbi:MAG TPA: ATP-binding cassette domain-containing protein [Actinospica sp.]|nr:ATP-binding cassette domain-containing protein [Actinospica sp.]